MKAKTHQLAFVLQLPLFQQPVTQCALVKVGPVESEFDLTTLKSNKSSSGYFGVYKQASGRFQAMIRHGKKQIKCLGTYDTAKEAAIAIAKERLPSDGN